MKVVILLALLTVLTVSSANNWAVLVAGSKAYYNYRHQADVFHCYQAIVAQGFDPKHIIVMAYNDIASSPSNPYPGKVFNKPSYGEAGVDVYEGIKIDYEGAAVTPANFLAVLEGDKETTGGKPVVEATNKDNVFVFFSDHGSVGLIAFPTSYLYADKLIDSLHRIKGKYNKFVFYLETCESGSMFQKLDTDTKIYALSAASPSESSWGCYCSPDDVVGGKHIGSCLGDLFSVNFIEDIDQGNMKESLTEQFDIVHKKTTKSKVMQWGDQSFVSDPIGNFITSKKVTENLTSNLRFIRPIRPVGRKPAHETGMMNSRTMKLQSLSALYAREKQSHIFEEMMEEMAAMKKLDSAFASLAHKLTLKGTYDEKNIQFDCLRTTVEQYEQRCGKFSDYGLQFIKHFAEACQKHSSETILSHATC